MSRHVQPHRAGKGEDGGGRDALLDLEKGALRRAGRAHVLLRAPARAAPHEHRSREIPGELEINASRTYRQSRVGA